MENEAEVFAAVTGEHEDGAYAFVQEVAAAGTEVAAEAAKNADAAEADRGKAAAGPVAESAEAAGPVAESAAEEDKGKADAAELTDEEKRLVRNYAVNDPEVRRAIISDYVGRLKNADPAPEVIRADAGTSPVFRPRGARDMREAAVLAEALLKRK